MQKIQLIRHAHTDHNGPPKRFQGRLDVPLSNKGRLQCKQSQNLFTGITHVLASPAHRVRETLEILFEHSTNPPKITYDERLWEINNGWFSGKLESEVEEIDFTAYNKWINSPADIRPGGGELLSEMLQRTIESLSSYNKEYGFNDNTLVATHGGIIRVLSLHSQKKNLNEFHSLNVKNLQQTNIDLNDVLYK